MKGIIFYLIFILIISFNQKSEAQIIINKETVVRMDSLNANLAKAKSFLKQGDTEAASKTYIRIMEAYPDNKDAVQGWIMANMKRTQTGESEILNSLLQLERSYPENTGIIFWKAFIEAESGQNESALKDIDRLIKIQPDTALNYILKGQVLSGMGNYKGAFEVFDRATSLDPERADVWGMKAITLAKTDKFDDALASINKGLELAPNDPASIYNRACIYCLKGEKENALADLKKAISMNPSFKTLARKDEDFRSLYNDEEFKKLTL